ncbi:hypothetical protein CLV59_108266 [Chitinophaga dinghuensis]|uniref:Uncharacterized protein n=1 Tax=Chitinophaga dinghuensis TaxID=1539050 RepID=A0A327VN21_9BACT|nr:hypothetical protein [Chitinophaga dinghuensis]RAJ76745.1 hypothetical protein CLV59_108266 [Chitinophaga dinghuensis]
MKLYREICLQIVFVVFLVCMMAWWMMPVRVNKMRQLYTIDTLAYFKKTGLHLLPQREFLTIELDSNEVQNRIAFDFAQLYMHQIIAKEDTIHGIHFHFGNGAKYEHLILMLDMFVYERAQCYLVYPADTWFIYCP